MKKVFSMLAILLLCFSLPVKASASTISFAVAQPYYEKANDAKSEFSIIGTTATCKSTVNGNSDVAKIVAEQ